ncbi:hypothetical protein TanjilG_07761 [Lupinus angustifolius]|uniref:DUF7651 domain-containing protein n=2 Tax=Lupinus angustifolius TaxID=3871 RepID=A0A1J7IK57_LUPAN|nr:hypothetical protein TanjilG_07761 [Lupinus angustifolius]
MKVSLSLRINGTENVAPLYICLGRQLQLNNKKEKQFSPADYQVSRMFKFQSSPEIDGDIVNAKYQLPEVYKFAEEAQSGSLYILVFTTVKDRISSREAKTDLVPSDEAIPRDFCLCGRVSLQYLYYTWDIDPSFVSSQMGETELTIDLAPYYIKREDREWRLSIEDPYHPDNETAIKKLPMQVYAEEYGAKDRPHYLTYSSRDILSPDLVSIMR